MGRSECSLTQAGGWAPAQQHLRLTDAQEGKGITGRNGRTPCKACREHSPRSSPMPGTSPGYPGSHTPSRFFALLAWEPWEASLWHLRWPLAFQVSCAMPATSDKVTRGPLFMAALTCCNSSRASVEVSPERSPMAEIDMRGSFKSYTAFFL